MVIECRFMDRNKHMDKINTMEYEKSVVVWILFVATV